MYLALKFKIETSKFSSLEANYPEILSQIKYKNLLTRPLKMSIGSVIGYYGEDEVMKLIEEIYQKRF